MTNRTTVRAVHPLYTNVIAEAQLESIDFRLEPVTVRTVRVAPEESLPEGFSAITREQAADRFVANRDSIFFDLA